MLTREDRLAAVHGKFVIAELARQLHHNKNKTDEERVHIKNTLIRMADDFFDILNKCRPVYRSDEDFDSIVQEVRNILMKGTVHIYDGSDCAFAVTLLRNLLKDDKAPIIASKKWRVVVKHFVDPVMAA